MTQKIIQISGAPEQVERAQSLIQGFILSSKPRFFFFFFFFFFEFSQIDLGLSPLSRHGCDSFSIYSAGRRPVNHWETLKLALVGILHYVLYFWHGFFKMYDLRRREILLH